MKDYYEILGVSRDATTEEIKRQFRRLARETHPDANPDDPDAEGQFREIAEAYEVLSNPERRAAYDRGDVFAAGDLFSSFGGLDEILQQFFGSGFGGFGFRPNRSGPQRGPDIAVALQLSLEDAAFGTSEEVTFTAPGRCETCGGSGAEPGTAATTCPTCGGRGRVQVAHNTLLGRVMTVADCSTCNGRGQLIEHLCKVCSGGGLVPTERTITVEVPKGVEDGTRLRLAGRGGMGERAGPPGDIYVEIRVMADDRFQRVGADLHHRVQLGITEATLGTEVEVPLLEGGTEAITIPPGTQPETVFKLSRQGVPRLQRRGRGDLLVLVDVVVPTDVDGEQEELLRQLAELRGETPTEKRRRLFRR